MIDVSAIIVNYNTRHLIERVLISLRESIGSLRLQICIVDNASRDSSAEYIQEQHPDCNFLANTCNVGFGRANNMMASRATGRYILLLNTDAFILKDSLLKSVTYMDTHSDCGILGAKLISEDGELQPSCRYFPTPWNVFLSRAGLGRYFPRTTMVDDFDWAHDEARECDWIPGCYYLIRRECFEQIGLFDPLFFLYYEEVDHCRLAKAAGWKVIYFPGAVVVHLGGESAKSDSTLTQAGRQISGLQVESELLYFRKHYGVVGLALSLVLSSLADIILASKEGFRAREISRVFSSIPNLIFRFKILQATSWAKQSTR